LGSESFSPFLLPAAAAKLHLIIEKFFVFFHATTAAAAVPVDQL